MFEWISSILENIANFFSTVWQFIITVFEEIVYIIKLLATVVINIPSYFTWLPPAALALVLVLIGIVVIYKIMGREG